MASATPVLSPQGQPPRDRGLVGEHPLARGSSPATQSSSAHPQPEPILALMLAWQAAESLVLQEAQLGFSGRLLSTPRRLLGEEGGRVEGRRESGRLEGTREAQVWMGPQPPPHWSKSPVHSTASGIFATGSATLPVPWLNIYIYTLFRRTILDLQKHRTENTARPQIFLSPSPHY